MADKNRVKKLEPYTPYWEKLANDLARQYCEIVPCPNCGNPKMKDYCCGKCRCDQ